MSSSTFNFKRVVPPLCWTSIAIYAGLLTVLSITAWELRCRRAGYAPTVNDSYELWAVQRSRVKPDSLVVIGDSRAWFDLDLRELEKGLGRQPIQLALSGSCVFPILEDFAADESFHGTLLCSYIPSLLFVPEGPPMKRSTTALERYHKLTVSERMGVPLAIMLEQRLAFMNMEELTLEAMLKNLPLKDRAGVHNGPRLPPYFNAMQPDRQASMIERCAQPGPLQDDVRSVWLPLFTPPPPPPGVSPEQALADFGRFAEGRMKATIAAVQKIRARGGKVIFIRFPNSGPLREHENKLTPRERTWEPLLHATGAPGIHFEDYPELSRFECPEWSHLKAEDATLFTRALVPHLLALK